MEKIIELENNWDVETYKNKLENILNEMSGFPNNCNGAEGIHNFGDLCKYGHVRQAKGGTRASPGTHPTLETNKQTFSMKQYTLETLAAANGGHILSLMTLAGHSLDPHFLLNKKKCTVILEKKTP